MCRVASELAATSTPPPDISNAPPVAQGQAPAASPAISPGLHIRAPPEAMFAFMCGALGWSTGFSRRSAEDPAEAGTPTSGSVESFHHRARARALFGRDSLSPAKAAPFPLARSRNSVSGAMPTALRGHAVFSMLGPSLRATASVIPPGFRIRAPPGARFADIAAATAVCGRGARRAWVDGVRSCNALKEAFGSAEKGSGNPFPIRGRLGRSALGCLRANENL